MKKNFLFIGMLLASAIALGQTTDSTAVVVYDLGDSALDFLKENLWTLLFVILYLLSEWVGESDKLPEGSLWRKILNIAFSFVSKRATKSAKMKRISSIYEKEMKAGRPDIDLSKSFKIVVIGLIMSAFTFNATAQKARSFRWYPFGEKIEVRADNAGADMPIYSKDSTCYFSPAVSFDIYTRGTTTGKHSIGAIPGIGYNFIYNPFLWEKNYLAGFGMFASAQQDIDNPDIFTFEVTPVVSLLNWIKIGYGHQWNFGGKNEWVLRIGIVKSL